jgi:ComF family protein
VDRGTCHSCRTRPPHFDLSYCLDRYDGLLQNALHQLKYQKRIVFAHGLAHAWNIVMSKELQNIEASYLLPVPLSEEKLAIRGFNQSWELARRIDHNRSIRKLPNALKRYHRTTQQAGNSWDTRLIQIQDSFYLESKAIPLLRNQSVVVFDDVMTSGATLDEIARVLKDNGVSRVTNWVLLRATKSI